MKKIGKAARLGALLLCGSLLGLSGCGNTHGLNPKSPITITVWHYYNGAQQQSFERMLSEFNATVGKDTGIIVDASSKGDVNELIDHTMDALDHKVGADKVPDIIAAYADTAYAVNERGMAADISAYLTDKELSAYLPAYIDEGRFAGDGSLKLFPIAKSTEIFILNKTDWDAFAAATGATDRSFQTWEDLADVSRRYYEWTDGLTPDVPNDGKSFFGRDAMANYLIIGSMQLGHELFSVEDGRVHFDVDEDAMYRLWENFYIPYVNGWYTSSGRFRSDDVKTGDIVALVGSTSSVTYFPTVVTRADGTTYDIESAVYPIPNFKDTEPYAVQQGAGMLITKSDETHEYAASLFLKWFTSTQNNLQFSADSGYLPVTLEANNEAALSEALDHAETPPSDTLREVLLTGVKTTQSYTLYTNKAFAQGNSARKIVDGAMLDIAKADRLAVEERLAQGLPHAEAVAPYVTRAHFEEWLDDFRTQLESLL